MPLKDLLVHLDSSRHCRTRLELAASLARRFDAHLAGIYVRPPSRLSPLLADQFPPSLIEEMDAQVAQRRDLARAAFEASARGLKAGSQWREVLGDDAAAAVTAAARVADLTIVGQADPDEAAPDLLPELPEHVGLDAGRPVLVVPYAGAPRSAAAGSFAERVLVAWNASPQAARAVNNALPLLAEAKRVLVVAINPESGPYGHSPLPGADIALHLARHGIKAEASAIQAEDVAIGDMLLSRAADEGVDLIVMGVYGHSRLRELVLGGVSRQIFAEMTVPVLMSH